MKTFSVYHNRKRGCCMSLCEVEGRGRCFLGSISSYEKVQNSYANHSRFMCRFPHLPFLFGRKNLVFEIIFRVITSPSTIPPPSSTIIFFDAEVSKLDTLDSLVCWNAPEKNKHVVGGFNIKCDLSVKVDRSGHALWWNLLHFLVNARVLGCENNFNQIRHTLFLFF